MLINIHAEPMEIELASRGVTNGNVDEPPAS